MEVDPALQLLLLWMIVQSMRQYATGSGVTLRAPESLKRERPAGAGLSEIDPALHLLRSLLHE
jgi:hypothetical protein